MTKQALLLYAFPVNLSSSKLKKYIMKNFTLLLFCFTISFQSFTQNILWEHNINPQIQIDESQLSEFRPYSIGQPVEGKVYNRSVPQELADTLQAILDLQREDLGVIGLSAAVNFEDGDIWAGGSGLSSVQDSLIPEMVLGIGSISKTFTAAAILQLYDEGLLHLDDSIGQWLDVYQNINPAATIRQLLNHTSGIYNYTNNPSLWNTVNADLSYIWTPEEILTGGYVLVADFAPGTDWNYSNTGYILLGLIIEAATGEPYADVIRLRFLDPYALGTTALYPDEEDLMGPLADVWADLNGNGLPSNLMVVGYPIDGLFSAIWSAGSYTSTPSELSRWAKDLYAGSLFQPTTFDEMIETVTVQPGFSYGLGMFELLINNELAWGHGGDLIYSSQMYYFPDKGISMAIQCNDQTLEFGSSSLYPAIALMLQTVCEYTPVETEELAIDNFVLQAKPSPFGDILQLTYELDEAGPVELSLYDISGRLIANETENWQNAGSQQIILTGLDNKLNSGFYFCKIRSNKQLATRKLIKQ